MRITSADNEVRALQIQDFSWGIWLDGTGASDNKITRSYLGTDGTTAIDTQIGVRIDDASNNIIGTNGDGIDDALEGNVISGNSSRGISISGTGATGNVVAGNRIGTNAAGTTAVSGQNQDGVFLLSGADNTRIGTDGDGISDAEERNIISGNPGAGVYISGPSGVIVAGNYIGTDVTGATAVGNATYNDVFSAGIYLGGSNARIGTNGDGVSDLEERNVISGNNFRGVIINGGNDNVLAGNYIGVDATGQIALGNASNGIYIGSGSNNRVGTNGDGVADEAERNIISGNTGTGVAAQNSSVTGTVIAGNYIGTDTSGAVALGNGQGGISVSSNAANTRIGTNGDGIADAVEGNVVSGNTGNGINAYGQAGDVVAGNFIGTDATGTAPLGNSQWGMQVSGAVLVGSNGDSVSDAVEANIISNNGQDGIFISGSGATIAGNIIGADVTGAVAMGNSGHGILTYSGTNLTIGGSNGGNTIANNGGDGVYIAGGTGNLIANNSIFSNAGLGVDLGSDGVAANDSGDGDTGANNHQNYPVLTSASLLGSDIVIAGALDSVANTTYTVEFYANSVCDASGHGEGARLIGLDTITTDASGTAVISSTFTASVANGESITALATDPGNNTSEFSACVTAIEPNDPPIAVNDSYTTDEDTALNVPAAPPVTTIQPLLPADVQVSGGTSAGEPAIVAFDGSRYLVVYYQDGDVYGRFLDTDGTADAPFIIATGSGNQIRADVAFNGSYYLVAYEDNGANRVKVQAVDTAGFLIGTPLILTNATTSQSEPAVASDGNGFLVVWQDGRNSGTDYYDVRGHLIDVNGSGASLNGTEFMVSPAAESQSWPSVAYGGGTYLVSWSYDPFFNANLLDIQAALVSPAGVVSSPIDVNTATGFQGNRESGIAFDGSNFLIVSDDTRSGSAQVYGARVSPTGVLLDGPAATGGILISASAGFGSPHRPKAAAGSAGWLVVWGGTDVRGARVAADGAVIDSAGADLFVTSDSQWDPAVAFDGSNFLTTWRSSPSPYTKYAQLVGEVTLTPGSLLSNDSDANGDTLTAVLDTPPTSGSLTLNGDGSFTYAPNADYCGADSFTYHANDGQADSNVAAVSIDITCVNDAPVALDDGDTVSEDGSLTVAAPGVLDNDTDIENDPLTAVLDAPTSHGSLTFNSDGSYGYTPALDYCGADTFTYHANDGQADSNIAATTITVICINDDPVANNDTATTDEDTAVTLDVLANDTDVDGDTLTVAAVTQPNNGSATINPDGTINYTPDANFNDSDTFSYDISDGNGGTNTAVVTITVTPMNDAPNAVDDASSTTEDTPVTVDLLANDTDVDGDSLTINSVTQPLNGTVVINGGSTITYTPDANYNGGDNFSYTIGDGYGGTDTAVVTVTVQPVNDAPDALDDTAATDEDAPVTIDVLANDSDVDGDALTAVSTTAPGHGAVLINGGATVTYTPDADYNGSDSFTYTVDDGNGGTDTAAVTVTIAPVNDNPVAVNDAVTTNEDTAVTITVLANDADVDGDAITVSSATTAAQGAVIINPDDSITYTPDADFNGSDSFTYTVQDGNGGADTATVTVTVTPVNDAPIAVDDTAVADEDAAVTINVLANDSDIDEDSLNVATATAPAHGSVNINFDNSITYTPDADYHGSDSFSYTINDGNGDTDTAVVTLTVMPVNDAPVAGDDAVVTPEDVAVTIDVLANDNDVDGDTITVTAVTQPGNGSAVINPDGTVTYTPDASFNGADTFTYTAADGQGGSDLALVTVTITAENDNPVAADDTATTAEDTALTIDVLANDTDIDGDVLTIDNVTQPDHGTISNNGSVIIYTPDPNYHGPDSFVYTAGDGNGGSDTAVVSVTVLSINDLPTAGDDIATTSEDTAVTIDVLANDTDVDGDLLTTATVTQPANGAVTNNGADVTYTPDADFNGSDSFTYMIDDGFGGNDTATVTVTITPVNDAPNAVNDSATTAEDTAVTIDVLANDSDVEGDTLAVTTVSTPTHGTLILNPDQTIIYTPDGNYNGTDSFTYTVTDGPGDSSVAAVDVSITPVNDLPVAEADTAAGLEDTAVTIDVLANDTDVDGDALAVTAITPPAHGSVVINPDNSVTYTPDTNYFGPDSFNYTVDDGSGGTADGAVSLTITAVNDAPVAANDTATTPEDTPVTVDALVNDTDADGDVLTINSVTAPVHGAVVVNGDGSITYTPDADYNGIDSFGYTVSDGNGGVDTAVVDITITPVNDAPVAVNDAVSALEDTAVTVTVLANDNDVDGDSLTMTAVTQPANGAAAFTNVTVDYIPNADFCGSDAFTYTITDGHGESASANVILTVACVNDAPVAIDDGATTNVDTAVIINVLSNDFDIDLDALTVISTTLPAAGGTAVINPDNTITYSPAVGFSGADTFEYAISDGNGGAATASVTVEVVPDVPQSDLSVTKTDSQDPIAVEHLLTYTIIIANNGPMDAAEVTLVDTLPALVTFESFTASQGTCVEDVEDTITCNLGALPVGGSIQVTIDVMPEEAGEITNTVTVSGDKEDPDLANNSADETTTVTDGSFCAGYPATIIGTPKNDVIIGTPGDDVIVGRAGKDTIDGGGGNDIICGGRGKDTLYGGDGDDLLKGGRGDDTLEGGDGNDELIGGRGRDLLKGQAGNDTLKGRRGEDDLYGGSGDDILRGGRGEDYLNGGLGADELYGGRGEDTLEGAAGSDLLIGGHGKDLLKGQGDDDTLYGKKGEDELFGGSGSDILNGGPGDDLLNGGSGNDNLNGGNGADNCVNGEVIVNCEI